MREARELSKLPWAHDEGLSTDTWEARVLADGRVLLYWPVMKIGNLCPSREAAEEMKRGYEETSRKAAEQSRRGPVDPCLTLLPPIDDFLRDVEAHAKSLGPRLRIPDEVLDGTPESLDAVDKALKRIPWAKRQVPDLVTPLVAYLGEVMRRGRGGRWIKGHEDEPVISASGGRLFQPFASVFLPMVEPSRRIPLRSSVGVPYRPPPKPTA